MSTAQTALEKVKQSVHNLETFKELINYVFGYPADTSFDYFLDYYNPLMEELPKKGINWALNEEIYIDERTSPCAFLYVVQKLSGQQFYSLEELTKTCFLIDEKFDLDKKDAKGLLELAYHSGRGENLRISYEYMCEIGCQYQDLLKVDRAWFGLPETWIDEYYHEVNLKYILERAIAFGLDLEMNTPSQIKQKAKKFGVSSKFLTKLRERVFNNSRKNQQNLLNMVKNYDKYGENEYGQNSNTKSEEEDTLLTMRS